MADPKKAADAVDDPPTPDAQDAQRPAISDLDAACPEEQAAVSSVDRDAAVKALYFIMQSVEGRIGGGEGVEGLYGSISRTGMARVLAAMAAHCDLGRSSCLVDVGAGLGRPLLHALVSPGVGAGFGVEVDAVKCDKAAPFLSRCEAALRQRRVTTAVLPVPAVQCAPVEQMRTLDPATHAYSFWEGVPCGARTAFGALFAASATLTGVAVVQRAVRCEGGAEAHMADLGFGPLRLVDSFPVTMSGSGRSFRAYVFRRLEPPGPGAPRHDDLSEAAYAALVDPVVNREPRQTSGAAATDEEADPSAGHHASQTLSDGALVRRSRRVKAAAATAEANACREELGQSENVPPNGQDSPDGRTAQAAAEGTPSKARRPRGVRRAAKAALAWTQRLTPPSAKSPLSAQQHPPGLTAEAPPNPSQTSNLGAAQLTGQKSSPIGKSPPPSPPRGVKKPASPARGRGGSGGFFSRLRSSKAAAKEAIRAVADLASPLSSSSKVPDAKAPKARRGLALDAMPIGLARVEDRSGSHPARSEVRVLAKAHQC